MKATGNRLTLRRRLKNAANALFKGSRWDTARTVPADRGLWRWADNLSINRSLDRPTRDEIRRKARYLAANNSYAKGAIMSIVNATVGSYPRIQLSSPDIRDDVLGMVEKDFQDWAREVRLSEKLRTMRQARAIDGEAFALLVTNKNLKHDVKLDLRLFDCDRVRAPLYDVEGDGIEVNNLGVPVRYRVLDRHPGDIQMSDDATMYPASQVIHWFRQEYPEQRRGYSELSQCIESLQLVDRYSLAVVQAAETAADLALVMHTDQYADSDAQFDASGNPFKEFSFGRGEIVTLPEQWSATQIDPKHPSSNYAMLVNEILSQAGSGLGVPKLLMKNSAENYNYSSARVDLMNFQVNVRIDRQTLVDNVLRKIFERWILEYNALAELDIDELEVQFNFDSFYSIDPEKEANAAKIRLETHLSTLADEWAKTGKDWEDGIEQLLREQDKIKELNNENQS